MLARSLGQTGMTVSPIGFGSVKIGRNQGTKYGNFAIPSDREAERLLRGILDLGINLIDTAPAYGLSEERIGRLLADQRQNYLLSTKVGESFVEGHSHYDFSPSAIEKSLAQSLRQLRTDYVDIVLIHSHGRDHEVLKTTDLVETLQILRDKGWARAIGFSGKIPAEEIQCLDWADVMMVEYHAQDATHANTIDQAKERGVGVLIKKGLDSGQLSPKRAIEHVLANQGVGALVIGGLSLNHFKENCRIATELASCAEHRPPQPNTQSFPSPKVTLHRE